MAGLEKGQRELLEVKDTVTGQSTKPVGTPGSSTDNSGREGGAGKKLDPEGRGDLLAEL